MFSAFLAAAAQLTAPAAAAPPAPEALARERTSAFADALQSGAPLPDASPQIRMETYFRPRYSRTESGPEALRAALAGCRPGEVFVHAYGPRSHYVAVRYYCPSDPQSVRWPVLEQEVYEGRITMALVATGPRQLERSKIKERPGVAADPTLAADRAAALALISAIQAGRTSLPHARPGLQLHYRDYVGRTPFRPVAALLRRSLAGCTVGTFDSERRRWLGSRLAIVSFSCPGTHKPHPEMAILLELLDGRVQSFELEAGPPPPPMIARPATN